MSNPRNGPPAFLADCLRAAGYETVPAIAASLGCSVSWVRKLLGTSKLRGRLGDKPKVITTGGAGGGACIWVLVEAARGAVGR